MLEDGINDPNPSIDPPDNGGTGLASLSSAIEEALGEGDEAIDPPDNGGTE